jgi:hypothetical protein
MITSIRITRSGPIAEVLSINTNLVRYPHVFIGFSYFSDAALTIPATPGAGSIVVVGVVAGAQDYSPFIDSPIDCTDLSDSANRAAPLLNVRATPTGITVATHYKMTLVGNIA